ncbi:MAG: hypothetical protein A3A98_02140 [Candidatus Staskawiczbacteria bacterium RIFCSPLOWO2_01_FULL_40_39]|nr:MAG: hypothetical protein A3A98_02140 [Candidatus Staskawiczbacteria bacterium RIFCSPLOWO2_01_FULL_40_39]OGZ76242.1 MAG: hypothetical protein A3I87_02190 [Candidatus Staskawiczbacteria bacterium RIFCSPLOWO2_02_FULL_39_8]
MSQKIKNITKAADRIRLAVENNEKIIIYGDSDLDGIASSVLLEEAIKNLGGSVFLVMFPDRENDGYGINLKALNVLKDEALASPALFITVDLGIGNVKEVEIAKQNGLEVIIVDHHEILDKIPDAHIVVDPRQEGDDHHFTYLSNAGITFKLGEELLKDNMSEKLRDSFLELAALATISDMMPQIEDNKIFIERGLRSLKNTFRPGLRAFLDILGAGEAATMPGVGKIISALNAAESVDFKNDSYALLTSSSLQEARDLAGKLIAKTQQKQQKIKEITEEVERRISQKKDEPVIFEGDPAWKLLLAGSVASIIAQRYEKPTFIFKKMETESCGSVRSIKDGQNSVEAMKSCADLLMTFGGHPKASGFRVKNENLEKFKNCLQQHFIKHKT